MQNEDILKYLDSLHEKIVRSSFSKNVTENEITALIECKGLMTPKKPMIDPMNIYTNGESIFICPKCREEVTALDPECQEWKMDFCANCGQRLEWSD